MTTSLELEPTTLSPEVVQNSPEIENQLEKAKADLAEIAISLCLEKSPDDSGDGYRKVAELLLGEKVEGLDQKMIERVATLSMELGPDYDAQRPEIKLALAELPILGKTLEENADGEVANNGQEITPDNMVFVRSTDFLPQVDDGEKTVLTPFEATRSSKDPTFRLTTHWTANCVVENHLQGNDFQGRKAIIIAPGKEMLDINGTPEAMLAVDTYWNHNIKLPEKSVVITYEKGALKDGVIELEEEDDSESIASLAMQAMGYTTVKNQSSTNTELAFDRAADDIAKEMGIEENTQHMFMDKMENAIEDCLESPMWRDGPSLDEIDKLAGKYWNKLPPEVQKATINALIWWVSGPKEKDYYTYNDGEKIQKTMQEIIDNPDGKFSAESIASFVSQLPPEVIDYINKNRILESGELK